MKPKRIYYYRGSIERGNGKPGYDWVDGYSENSENGSPLYPWATKKECRAEAKRDGVEAVFKNLMIEIAKEMKGGIMSNVVTLYEARERAAIAAAAELVKKYPWLVEDKGNSLVTAAKNIRIELARAFPGIKFGVSSRRFSMGDAIDVKWIDGPCSETVDRIINKYAAGSFDGMTDSYTYSSGAWNRAFGDAKYVHSSRDYSDRAVASCIRTVATRYAGNLARTPALPLPTVEDYRKGRMWNMVIASLPATWGELLNRELFRRTWILERRVAA